ncbi:hypothetical protein ADO06_01353 [Streptococcus parauberis]|nr:hypothetical protein ADO06_01353 [Streptococcus parauberis]
MVKKAQITNFLNDKLLSSTILYVKVTFTFKLMLFKILLY